MIRVKSLVTASVGKSGYRQFPANMIEAFAIESAMDTDSDTFSIDLGAPTPGLKFLTHRDNEVRVTLFTDSMIAKTVEHLQTGIADIVSYDSQDHIISIAGRDLSSMATDSQGHPGEWRKVRPDQFVAAEARALGITRIRAARVTNINRFYRDASESYWESWYRMYRKKKMWVWFEPDGTLMADKLNYSASPNYFFGRPAKGSPRHNWIPVEQVKITKDSQQRIGEVWVFGERGDLGFIAKAVDPSIRTWKKRPLKILTSQEAKNRSEALQEAWEEIFEGKVGSLEISVRIPHLAIGRLVKQNQMAEVNIPDMGLHGIFFVVGANLRGGSQGYWQEIRLREKNFAISRRVPSDPKLEDDPSEDALAGDIGATLRQSGVRWANSFASAALEFHDGWPYDLFLGVLLSICDKESNFRNVPESGDTEWFPRPSGASMGEARAEGTGIGGVSGSRAIPIENWQRLFANHAGSSGNPFNRERGVGPMQLTTRTFKEWADQYGGKSDEYEGGRWVPQANIRAGARAFAEKLVGLDPQNPNLIWEGVRRYNGSGSAAFNYRDIVRAIYNQRYSGIVAEIEKSANSVPLGETTNVTVTDANGRAFDVKVPKNAPTGVKKFVNYLIRQLGKPYQWGAEGPGSFDCSGLVMAAARAAGDRKVFSNASRPTTYTLFSNKSLVKIGKDALAPGDLVFFNNLSHMGIYLNDGHFIHAPSTGDVVKISPLSSPYYRDRYEGARRIFGWPTDRWWSD